MQRTVLAVDDKPNVLMLLREFLSEHQFFVDTATNGIEALEQVAKRRPDIILLDVMMPQMDGYQFIKRVRRTSDIPIIMVTAKRHENDIVRGFELGADDYIVKPFKMRELLMRMRAVLRRTTPVSIDAEQDISVGDIVIYKAKRELLVRGQSIECTPIEYHLMEKMVDLAEHTLTRAELCTYLVDNGYTGSESTLKIHIRNLRQKIEINPSDPKYIETVFGVGYRLREYVSLHSL